MKFKNKKGDVIDILSLLVIIFILGVGLFTIAFIIPYITTGLKTAGLNNSVQGINAIDKLDDFGSNGIQRGFLFLFIGLCIGVLISSFYVDTHPVWLFLYIIMLVISVILAAYLSNSFETITANASFNGFTQTYISTIMSNIIKIIIGVAALSFIIIFSKFAFGSSNAI